MQNISTTIKSGLFNADAIPFSTVSDAMISTDISGCKDPILVLIDVPQNAEGCEFSCLPAKAGFKKESIKLESGVINGIFITSHGYKKDNGFADFEFSAVNGGVASMGIKVAFVKQVSVINH